MKSSVTRPIATKVDVRHLFTPLATKLLIMCIIFHTVVGRRLNRERKFVLGVNGGIWTTINVIWSAGVSGFSTNHAVYTGSIQTRSRD